MNNDPIFLDIYANSYGLLKDTFLFINPIKSLKGKVKKFYSYNIEINIFFKINIDKNTTNNDGIAIDPDISFLP